MDSKQHLFNEALEFVKGNQTATDLVAGMQHSYRMEQTANKRRALYYFMTGFDAASGSQSITLSNWLADFVLAE